MNVDIIQCMVLLSNSLLLKASTNIMEYSKDRQDSILPTTYTSNIHYIPEQNVPLIRCLILIGTYSTVVTSRFFFSFSF
jgi:hypothetical protein